MEDSQHPLSALRHLSIIGGSRTPANGTTYTPEELRIAKLICRIVLTTTNSPCNNPINEQELLEHAVIADIFKTAKEVYGQFKNVGEAIRKTYRLYESYVLTDSETLEHFPKVDQTGQRAPRNQSSINVLLRKVIKDLVSKELRDQIFKPQHIRNQDAAD